MRVNSVYGQPYQQLSSKRVGSNKNFQTQPVSFQGAPVLGYISFLRNLVKPAKLEQGAQALRLNFKNYSLVLNNPVYAKNIQETYTPSSFKKLVSQAQDNGVFKFKVDEATGIVKTSDIAREEDYKMADGIWISDSCRNMTLLKKDRPEMATKAFEFLSSLYKSEQPEFDMVINNPSTYKLNPGWNNGGIAHEFDKENLKPNRDFPRLRLESPALYLRTFTDLVTGGIIKGEKWGYKSSAQVSDNAMNAVSSCVKYLKAIDYHQAHSCGFWEEAPHYGSITSDTAEINRALTGVVKFMYGKTKNPEILQIRQRLLNSKHGDVFNDRKAIVDQLKKGKQRVISNHDWEAPEQRKLDAAMAFASHDPDGWLTHSNDLMTDVKEHIRFLSMIEGTETQPGLLGEYGMKRYINDAYKNIDSDIPGKGGKTERGAEAQWFMVSDMATAYGTQIKRVLNNIKHEQRTPNKDEKGLIKILLDKEIEMTNRSFARITGAGTKKANLRDCPENKIPEAYQAVTNENNNIELKPGTNSPLAWAQSSLIDASNILCENLKRLEKIGVLKELEKINIKEQDFLKVA